MNITQYQVGDNEYQVYHGKASIRDGYHIVNADERFYHLIGRNSGFPLTELFHPEDVEEFLEAAAHLDEGAQCMTARILTDWDTYRYVYVRMSYNGKIVHGFRSFDMEITDVMAITERYKLCTDQMNKYRKMMSLHDGVFIEYSYEDDMLQMYEYFNGKDRRLFYKNLTDLMQEVRERDNLSENQKDEFLTFGEMIHKRADYFKLSFDADVVADTMPGTRFECKCSLFYKEEVHYKMVGLVHYSENRKPKQSYYMTENAIDPGTGLLNKRGIHEYALECIQNQREGVYLVLVDIDDFKQINDKFGHMFGDEVIATSAEILRSATQKRGMAGRFGGDEFMLVFENVHSEEELRRILKVICKHVDWAFGDKEGLKVSYSIGISKFPENGADYEELFKTADKALYIAKEKGKNRYIIYREELHGSLVKTDDSDRNVGLKATVSDLDKHMILSQMMLKLHRDKKDAIDEVMREMQTYFDVDGIAIYTGMDMKRTYAKGNYVNPIENLHFVFEPAYLEQFDQNDCYMESNMAHLTNRSPLAYQANIAQETGRFIQCVEYINQVPAAVVSYDFFNRSPKVGNIDYGIMLNVAKMLMEIVLEHESCIN